MGTNKKGGNPMLAEMLAAARKKEKEVISTTTNQKIEKNENTNDSEIESSLKLSEKEQEVASPTPVIEKVKPEKDRIPPISLSEKNFTYSEILKKRAEKESVEKGNILTSHRDILKRIAMAEGIPLQDLTANIIDDFLCRYKGEIKQSTKKLLM